MSKPNYKRPGPTVGDRMKERMAELGLRQSDLVQRTQLSQGMLNHLCRNRVLVVNCVYLFELADVLQCDARWLALGEEKK